MERELIYFLVDIGVKWGLCLPADDLDKISTKEYYNADEFAYDVLLAVGMEGDSRWSNRIAESFIERFGSEEIDAATFVDRVRGVQENWQS